MRPQERAILREMAALPQIRMGRPVDWRKYQALRTVERAMDALVFRGDQWERGEAAHALSDALDILRTCQVALRDELFPVEDGG